MRIASLLINSFCERKKLLLSYAVLCLMGLAALANYLKQSGYSLFEIEIIFTVGIIALVGLVLTLIASLSTITRNLTYASCITILTLTIFPTGFKVFVPEYLISISNPLFETCCLFALSLIATVLLRSKFEPLALVFLSTFVISTVGYGVHIENLAGKSKNHNESNNSNPPIIHIILDEHPSLSSTSESKQLNDLWSDILENYQRMRFEPAISAYSDNINTTYSLTSIFNTQEAYLDLKAHIERVHPRNRTAYALKTNAFFEKLRQEGYKINILQNNYLDFCKSSPVEKCDTYNIGTFGNHLNLSSFEKSKLILATLIERTRWKQSYEEAKVILNFYLGVEFDEYLATFTINSSASTLSHFNKFSKLLRSLTHGEYLFYHALLPHNPAILNHECQPSTTQLYLKDRPPHNQKSQNVLFLQQICIHSLIQHELKSFLETHPESMVIIHGDHGARNTKVPAYSENTHLMSEDDIKEAYETALFIKPSSSTQINSSYFTRHIELDSQRPLSLPSLFSSMIDPDVDMNNAHHFYISNFGKSDATKDQFRFEPFKLDKNQRLTEVELSTN